LRFLLITLAITPAQRILHYPRIILARRTLGVACAAYAGLHLSLYVLDQHFDLFKAASEIALLATVHFFIQSKLEIYEPVLMAGLLLWLLTYRVLYQRNGEVTPLYLLLLAAATAAATAAGEATIYMLTSGVDAHRILLAHFDIDMEVRPAWWVLAAGLTVTAVGFWRNPARQRPSARRISPSVLSAATQVQSGS